MLSMLSIRKETQTVFSKSGLMVEQRDICAVRSGRKLVATFPIEKSFRQTARRLNDSRAALKFATVITEQ